MDPIGWLPSITTTALLASALWLARNLIATRLKKSVEHEFDTKLESVRAELRNKEESLKADLQAKAVEIAALRGGAMTAMASRQVALDKRRQEAVDQLWSAVTALGPAKVVSSVMAVVKFEAAAEAAATNEGFRKVFEAMGSGFDPKQIDLSGAAQARPFVTPMAWALFSAYQSISMQAVVKLEMIKSGIAAKDLLEKDAIPRLLKAVLPHRAAYIDKFGDTGYHYLLEELEEGLLNELRGMLDGVDADKASVEQAAAILKLSNDLLDSTRQRGMPPHNAFPGKEHPDCPG